MSMKTLQKGGAKAKKKAWDAVVLKVVSRRSLQAALHVHLIATKMVPLKNKRLRAQVSMVCQRGVPLTVADDTEDASNR